MTAGIEVEPVQALLAKVAELLDVQRAKRDPLNKTEAPDFNVVDLFWPGENQLSYLLAYFLDPKQAHAQGAAFLRFF